MNKTMVLDLLTTCKEQIREILQRNDLTNKQKKQLDAILSSVCYHLAYIEDNVKEDNTQLLQQYYDYYSDVLKNLKVIAAPVSIEKRPEGQLVKVEEVIPEDKQTKKAKKNRGCLKAWLKALAVIVLIIAIIHGIKSCTLDNSNDNDLDDTPTYDTTVDDENKKPIDSIDIDNYNELLVYAQGLQSNLPQGSNITIEDIMYAIRLANFDRLDNKAIFENRDEVYESTKVLGNITSALGSDNIVQKDNSTDIFVSDHELKDMLMCVTDNKLSISAFDAAKTDNGYDVYAIADICSQRIYANDGKDVLFAKVFNDLLARKAVAFTITESSPLSTYYTLLGMYNANSKRILELTSKLGLTSIYGDGERIDGYYGFTCVEELEAYLQIGNKNNVLYTDLVDLHITSHTKNQSR